MKLTETNVKQVLIDASMQKAVFLYFYAEGPECAASTQALTSAISDDNAYVSLVLADIKEPVSQAVAMQLGLRGVPALIVFKDGKPVEAMQGDEITADLQATLNKYMPDESELMLRDALTAEAAGNMQEALTKAKAAYEAKENNLQAKYILARLYLKNKNLARAKELLANPGREESASAEYKELLSALTLAEQAQDSPALHKLEQEYEATHDDAVAIRLSSAYVEAGKKDKALELLFNILKADSSKAEIKKTFLDVLSTMAGDPLQGQYRRKLYTLMY